MKLLGRFLLFPLTILLVPVALVAALFRAKIPNREDRMRARLEAAGVRPDGILTGLATGGGPAAFAWTIEPRECWTVLRDGAPIRAGSPPPFEEDLLRYRAAAVLMLWNETEPRDPGPFRLTIVEPGLLKLTAVGIVREAIGAGLNEINDAIQSGTALERPLHGLAAHALAAQLEAIGVRARLDSV